MCEIAKYDRWYHFWYVLRITLVEKTIYEKIYIIVIRWGNLDNNKDKSYSTSSSAVWSGIYFHHGFSKASIPFIIAVLFVYIYGLSYYSEAGKTYMCCTLALNVWSYTDSINLHV